jgi:hypothetical protein
MLPANLRGLDTMPILAPELTNFGITRAHHFGARLLGLIGLARRRLLA